MADQPARPAAPPVSSSPILMLMMMFLMLMIIIDPSLRSLIGNLVGLAFMPTVGFDYQFPLWTLLMAGIVSITFSTVLRHYMIDWVEMARINRKSGALRKELFAAMKRRDMSRVDQLNKLQQESSAETMGVTMNQMKPTMITMVLVIGVFTWVYVFIEAAPNHFFSVPWEFNVDFLRSNVLPNWILLYSLLTMPVTQVLGRFLKWFGFSRRLKALEGAAQ
ncbi:MAG: EMC3/TMCO1 family protein [Methanobacteriota archaeon]